MNKNTTVEYARRLKTGHKSVTVRTAEWRATVSDFQDGGDGTSDYAGVSIHAAVRSTGDAVIGVQDHSDDGYSPFYVITVGTGVGAALFLSPDQTKALLGLLERALDNDPTDGHTVD